MPGRDQHLLITLAPPLAEGLPGPNDKEFSGPLVVNKHRICSCSKVAAALAEQGSGSGPLIWDLSCLLVPPHRLPVRRATVVAWLNSIYRAISSCDFEEQTEDTYTSCTASSLIELLAFADAVDTERGILLSCLPDDLVIRSSLGDQAVQLLTDGRSYCFDGMQLCCSTATGCTQVGMPAGSPQDQQQLSTDVAGQLEQLLFLAYSMQLQPLIHRLHRFLSTNAANAAGTAILYGVLGQVFTPRVITAALGPAAAAAANSAAAAETRKRWISSVLTQPVGFVAGTGWSQQLLNPVRLPSQLQAPWTFTAELQHDWLGSKKGDTVPVELDLFDSSTVTIGPNTWGVQLLLGPAVTTGECDHRRLMCSRQPRASQP